MRTLKETTPESVKGAFWALPRNAFEERREVLNSSKSALITIKEMKIPKNSVI